MDRGESPFFNGDHPIPRVPTLHHENSRNKRKSGQQLPRKKSSKRRKEDHDREAEIKAMSQFMPVRPATDMWTAGRPTKRESIRVKKGFRRSWDEHPSSDISLPVPESIDTTMSSDSEQVSWKVSAFAALAPRPTLRYSSRPIHGPASTSGPMRSPSSRKKLSDREPLPESALAGSRRIDDLADDLDASDLRELMERDKRRREKKVEKERERVERRLARRAEKQRREQAEATRRGTPSPQNLERGVLGRDLPTSGPDTTSAVVTSSRRRPSHDSPPQRSKESSPGAPVDRDDAPSPLDNFYRTNSIPVEPSAASGVIRREHEDKPETTTRQEPAPPRPTSPGLMNFIRSKKRRSRSPRQTDVERIEANSPPSISLKAEDAESGGGRTSDSGSSRPWMSLFRWGGKNRRGSGPSSFSNTSRDSMLANPPPQASASYVPRRVSAGVPKRTMSRFREDLPEMPLSPPDSRVASPEAEPMPTEPLPIIHDDTPMRYDTPTSVRRSQEVMRATPSSLHRDEVQASPAPQSMSLASIDSEASWLSGRVAPKRASAGLRSSLQTQRIPSGGSESRSSGRTDDEAIADDEYLNSVVPTELRRSSTGEAQASSDEEEVHDARWGEVGHTPTVMHHRETMRSREGLLLQSFEDDEKDIERSSENFSEGTFEEGVSPVEPQRATSVILKKGHVRNFSAGSAKLLDLSPRPSGENKRNTFEHGTQ
ncbi:hypothetical protein SLS62_001166 [Diatrype stigma]|uniref:Uncharacterized protein n=1 Tax=Diatrype stigma TaxID=117547 RepID=A0AAN9YWT6_9PEZI